MTIKFLPTPADDPETEEDEFENVPDPQVTGEVRTVVTNQKDETLKTLEDLVHQSYRQIQEGDAASYQSEPSFFARSYSQDTLKYTLRDRGHLRTTWTQAFLPDDVREVGVELEFLGNENRSDWEYEYWGNSQNYAVSYSPGSYVGGWRLRRVRRIARILREPRRAFVHEWRWNADLPTFAGGGRKSAGAVCL